MDKNQLKRIVRYLKAWTDNKRHLNLPNGMIFTILAVNNYVAKDRDDEAFLETLKAIQKSIDDTRHNWASYECKRPTIDKTENLLDKYSSARFHLLIFRFAVKLSSYNTAVGAQYVHLHSLSVARSLHMDIAGHIRIVIASEFV